MQGTERRASTAKAPPRSKTRRPSVSEAVPAGLLAPQPAVRLFAGLTEGQHGEAPSAPSGHEVPVPRRGPCTAHLHPSVARFVLRSAAYANTGGARRCREMLLALRDAVQTYRAPAGTAICRHLDHHYLKPLVGAMVDARPMATAMANAVRALRMHVAALPPEVSEHDAAASVTAFIDAFIAARLDAAADLVVAHGRAKIVPGDVVLTYGHSALVVRLLAAAAAAGVPFRAVVVDGRPALGTPSEGVRTLRELTAAGVPCTFAPLSAAGYVLGVLRDVTKTLVGAAAITANGALVARVGTAAVCAMSRRANVPVVVCCETLKFTDRAQTGAFVPAEAADADLLALVDGPPAGAIAWDRHEGRQRAAMRRARPGDAPVDTSECVLANWHAALPSLRVLNPVYDATPAESLTVVITEIGLIPATSIPVVLREYAASAPLRP